MTKKVFRSVRNLVDSSLRITGKRSIIYNVCVWGVYDLRRGLLDNALSKQRNLVFPQTIVLYVLSPCKPTKNLQRNLSCKTKTVNNSWSQEYCQPRCHSQHNVKQALLRPVYTGDFCCGFSCDFLFLEDVKE
jgi:hypothetical protein